MELRVARHTQRLGEIVSFYRDGIGLSEIGRFNDHEGSQGVFLALPGTEAHLEFTSGGEHRAPAPHPESLLVLYLGADQTVRRIATRLDPAPVPCGQPLLGRAWDDVRGSGWLSDRPGTGSLARLSVGG
jgi:hypothetical protein